MYNIANCLEIMFIFILRSETVAANSFKSNEDVV